MLDLLNESHVFVVHVASLIIVVLTLWKIIREEWPK
jgi:hypothetical protein